MRKDKYNICIGDVFFRIGDVFYCPTFKGFDDTKDEKTIIYVPMKYEIIDIWLEAYGTDTKPVFRVRENDGCLTSEKYLGDVTHWYETEEECLEAIKTYSDTGSFPHHKIEYF